jgi:hypothetical protein
MIPLNLTSARPFLRRLIARFTRRGEPDSCTLVPAPVKTRKRSVNPKGFADPRQRKGSLRIAVTFDGPLFHRVDKLAKAEGVSFSEKARQLIERGLQ